MNNILALDTSLSACSIALLHEGKVYSSHKIAAMQQAKLILPMIRELLHSVDLQLQDIDFFAYGCGPASFTGIRIASSVVQGLSFALNKPVAAVSSLALIAQSAYVEHQCDKVLVAVDARMEQIYWAAYQLNEHACMELVGQEQLCRPQDICQPKDKGWYGVGDAWNKYVETLNPNQVLPSACIFPHQLPLAHALLSLAQDKIDKKLYMAASQAIPVYLK